MDCSIVINSIGLILDISGVLILFRYGLPSKIHTDPGLLTGGITDEQKDENINIQKWAYFGVPSNWFR